MEATPVSTKDVYVTQSGLPLFIELKWPFHRSNSGADLYVLHADLHLAHNPELHAEISVNLSATLKEVLPSLERKDAEAPVINALRKQVDAKQVEFGKSVKMIPMHFSSRLYSYRLNQWWFGNATDEQIAELLLKKAYWSAKAGISHFWVADPIEAQYLGATAQKLTEMFKTLASKGLLEGEPERARAAQGLMSRSGDFEENMSQALKALEEKHAFERG